MRRTIASSIVVLAAACSTLGAVGDVTQIQDWALGLDSIVNLIQGAGQANVDQMLNLGNTQEAANIGLSTSASQSMAAVLNQAGQASGNCTVGLIDQSLLIVGITGGGQQQLITQTCGPIAETEGFGFVATQDIGKSAGPGAVAGTNSAILELAQAGANVSSNMAESTAITGSQQSGVSGDACSMGTVQTSMTASVVQVQSVN